MFDQQKRSPGPSVLFPPVTLQAANYIPRVGKRGQQDHWNMGKIRITLDLLAELVAVHLGHEDIADNSGWTVLTHKSDGITAVLGH